MKKSKTFDKASIKIAIDTAGSSVAAIAAHLGVTPRTVRNYLTEFELWSALATSKELLKMMAAGNVVQAVESGDVEVSQWVLERLGKNEGWAKRIETQGSDGSLLLELTPEVRKMMQDEGIDVAQVMRSFERMLQARAEQLKVEAAGPVYGPGPAANTSD